MDSTIKKVPTGEGIGGAGNAQGKLHGVEPSTLPAFVNNPQGKFSWDEMRRWGNFQAAGLAHLARLRKLRSFLCAFDDASDLYHEETKAFLLALLDLNGDVLRVCQKLSAFLSTVRPWQVPKLGPGKEW